MYPYQMQAQGPNAMPVNATNQQGSSVQGANTGMLGSMFGMGLGGFGGGFSPSGFSMPQMGYGGMGGYGGFGGGFGMPQMGYGDMGGYGGFGGFGMPQMGYGGFGGMGGYGGGFGMPQMGYGLGSFGSQVGFGGYGNYGGFQPPQFATTDVKFPYPGNNPTPGAGLNGNIFKSPQDAINYRREELLRSDIQRQLNDQFTRNKNAGMSLMDIAKAEDELSNRLYSQYGIERHRISAQPAPDIRITDGYFHGAQPNPPANNPPPGMELNPGYRGDDVIGMAAGPASMKYRLTQGANPPGGAYIPDETGQYDPNRGSFSSGPIAPTYSEPSAPGTEPLSIAGPPQVTQESVGTLVPANSAPINQPRRMRNSMNMGIGSFFGGIGPGNFRNFYNP